MSETASGSGSADPPTLAATPKPKRKRNDNKPTKKPGTATRSAVVPTPLPSPTPSSSSLSSESSASAVPAQDIVAESLDMLAAGLWKTVPKKFARDQKRRSEVWDTFHVVVDGAELEVGTAQCIKCLAILVYNGTAGPSSLKKHHDGYCSAELTTAANTPFRPVPGGLRNVFVDKVADTCALTMGAVNLITSDAVVDMLQVAVDIAARCKGRVDVRALMPCANTVLARIDSKADSATAELVPRVRAAIRDKRCQGSTDMWTDDQCKQHFIAVTVTFTNEEGVASETHDLITAKFPATVRATGEKIREAMVRTLQGIGIPPDEFEQIEWVTDRGANVIKALEDLPREDCAAHVINTVVRSALSVPYYELRGKAIGALSDDAQEVVATAEAVVKAVKAAPPGLNVQGVRLAVLKKSLVLAQANYHSKYSTMLSSVCLNKPKVLAVLEALARHDLAERLRGLHQTIFGDLVDFLGPLEKNKTVVGGDVASISRHLTAREEDSQEIMNMKTAVGNLRVLLEILLLIKEAKELVQYMKSTGLASLLKKRVMQEVETRWNSIHTMLFSVLDSYDEVVDVLAQNGEDPADGRMQRINRDQLQWLTEFLQEFKAETKTLEGNDHPTLPCVLLASANLRDHCEPALLDCPQLMVLKERCLHFLHLKFQPSIKGKVATFLWPDYKELEMLPENEREEVKAKVRALIAEPTQRAAADVADEDDPAPLVATDTGPPQKVPRLERYQKFRVRRAAEPQDEVDRYLADSASVPLNQLLQHWKMLDRPDGLPKLAKLALRELGKLATAAPSERV